MPCCGCPDYAAHYAGYHNKRTLHDLAAKLQFQLSDESLRLLPEYFLTWA